jgi:hypothetical protein
MAGLGHRGIDWLPVSCHASRTSDRYDHPKRRSHIEAINKEFLTGNKEFLTGLSDYWADRSEKNAQVLLDWLLTIEGTEWHYLHGVSDPSKISPDNWVIDQAYQDRLGNTDIQLSILYNAKRDLARSIWMAAWKSKRRITALRRAGSAAAFRCNGIAHMCG